MAKGEIESGFLYVDPPASETDSPCFRCQNLFESTNFVIVHATYESTNPQASGDGIVDFCFTDNGEGKLVPDEAAVIF
jgi:hypothetical protein